MITSPPALFLPGYKISLPLSSILFLKSKGNYTLIYCLGNQTFFCSWNLKRLLAGTNHFLRVSRGIAVNPDFILSLDKGKLLLHQDHLLTIARRRQVMVKKFNNRIASAQ